MIPPLGCPGLLAEERKEKGAEERRENLILTNFTVKHLMNWMMTADYV